MAACDRSRLTCAYGFVRKAIEEEHPTWCCCSAASLIATAGSAQAPTFRNVIIQPNFLQGSCVTMMQGWENGHSVQAAATINGVTLTNSGNRRMLALTKTRTMQAKSGRLPT